MPVTRFCASVKYASSASRCGVNHSAVINHFGVAQRKHLRVVRRLAVEAQRFEFAMRGDQQRAARRFVRAARFHPDQAIFDQVDASHAVRRRDFIQLFDQRHRGTLFAVHRNRRAGLESDFDVRRLVRRFFRRDDPLPHRFVRLVRGIFEHAAFVAQVPDVAVARINVGLGLLDGHVVRIAHRRWRLRAS